MTAWIMVVIGASVGAPLRYLIDRAVQTRHDTVFPWGTLTVNLLGSFVAGFLLVWLDSRGSSSWAWRALLIVGVMGGLTTFSSLMMECLVFARTDRSTMIALYLGITLLAGLLLVFLGARLGMAVAEARPG